MPNDRYVPIHITLPKATYDKLVQIAREEGRSVSNMINRILESLIARIPDDGAKKNG